MLPLQDLLLLRFDNRRVQHGALLGHLPPSVLTHDERIQEGGQDHSAGVGGLASGCTAVCGVHQGQLHRQVSYSIVKFKYC